MSQPLIEIINRKYVNNTPGTRAPRPVDASSIVLIDRRSGEPRFLMGKRNPAARFMPGFFVFPGGRVEKGDADVPYSGSLDAHDLGRLMRFVTRPTERRMRGLALAAIRELFEETGLRLSVQTSEPPRPSGNPVWAEFEAGGHIPTLDGLRLLARAVTPPGRPRRFDTRFFVRDMNGDADLTTIRPTPDSELVELRWVTFGEAATLDSAEITQMILSDLKVQVETGMPIDQPRPYYRLRHRRFERVVF